MRASSPASSTLLSMAPPCSPPQPPLQPPQRLPDSAWEISLAVLIGPRCTSPLLNPACSASPSLKRGDLIHEGGVVFASIAAMAGWRRGCFLPPAERPAIAFREFAAGALSPTTLTRGGGKGGGGKGYGSSFGGGGMSGKLAGSAAGRSSMYLAKLDLFVRGRTEWVRAMKRGAATQHLFKDFLSTSSSEKPAAAVGTAKVSTNFSSSSSQPSSEGSKKRGGVTAEATGSGCNGEEEGGGKKAKKAKPTERSTKKRRERETTTSSAQGALPPPAPSESRFLSALGFDAARDGGGGGVGIGGAVLPMKTTAPSSKSTTDATPSTIAPSTSLGFLKSALATAAAAVDNPDPKKKKKKKKKIAP
mmetsp:Transcript_10924/g.21830  ORF Transcript_10924/g.21830 Transcript_10924/m.21830 type:complete len:361 (+) Transcript_10924:227-1309(+)